MGALALSTTSTGLLLATVLPGGVLERSGVGVGRSCSSLGRGRVGAALPGTVDELPASSVAVVAGRVGAGLGALSCRDVTLALTLAGWHLHPDVWGQGIATESGSALLQHAGRLGLARVHAVTHPENTASQAVCHRLAMTDLGVRDDWYDRRLRAFVCSPR